jgi:hypothetical protein
VVNQAAREGHIVGPVLRSLNFEEKLEADLNELVPLKKEGTTYWRVVEKIIENVRVENPYFDYDDGEGYDEERPYDLDVYLNNRRFDGVEIGGSNLRDYVEEMKWRTNPETGALTTPLLYSPPLYTRKNPTGFEFPWRSENDNPEALVNTRLSTPDGARIFAPGAEPFPSTTYNFQIEPGAWSGCSMCIVFGGTRLTFRLTCEAPALELSVSNSRPAGLEHAVGKSADTHAWWYSLYKTQHRLAYTARIVTAEDAFDLYRRMHGEGDQDFRYPNCTRVMYENNNGSGMLSSSRHQVADMLSWKRGRGIGIGSKKGFRVVITIYHVAYESAVYEE